MESVEFKVEPTQIVSTVRSSSGYKSDLNGKVGEDEIISSINQTAEQIKIQASKISLEGFVSINNSFSIDSNGNFNATGGTIGGFTINDSSIEGPNGTKLASTGDENIVSGLSIVKTLDSSTQSENIDISGELGGFTNIRFLIVKDFSQYYIKMGTHEGHSMSVHIPSLAITPNTKSGVSPNVYMDDDGFLYRTT